jgi:hypothetical protein
MTNRGALERVLSTIAQAAALWALSAGVSSAQTCGGIEQPPCPTPGIVTCQSPEGLTCGSDGEIECSCPTAGVYDQTHNVNVFKFGNNNSIQIKFDQVTCPFEVNVELIPTIQADFQQRVTTVADGGVCPFTAANRPYPATPEITCNETVDVDGDGLVDQCAVYRVSFTTTATNGCYASGPTVVGYTIGWLDPAVKKNKHDYMLVRDPDFLDTNDDGTTCFSQDITDKLQRNYDVGTITDPGLGGRTCCPSEYAVALQRVRPAR